MDVVERVRALFARAKELKVPGYFVAHHAGVKYRTLRDVMYKGRTHPNLCQVNTLQSVERAERIVGAVERAVKEERERLRREGKL